MLTIEKFDHEGGQHRSVSENETNLPGTNVVVDHKINFHNNHVENNDVLDGTDDESVPPKKKQKHNKIKAPQVIPPAKENQCHFWVARKRRYCKLNVKKGHIYCGEHFGQADEGKDVRIPCPLNQKHTVLVSELDKHLLRCNARPSETPEYYEKDIHIGRHTPQLAPSHSMFKKETDAIPSVQTDNFDVGQLGNKQDMVPVTARNYLKSLPFNEFKALKEKIENLYKAGEAEFPIVKKFKGHSSLESKLSGLLNKKHPIQQASLLGNMEEKGFLNSENTFIEFGCGKGGLTSCIYSAIGDGANFILVDRRNFKQKLDKNLQSEKTTWQRLKIDIKDLNLTKVPFHDSRKMVAVSKHLCGCATDLTLRCLGHYIQQTRIIPTENNGENHSKIDTYNDVEGIIIATCCHQLCQYGMYVNLKYLVDNDISYRDFAMISTMSTWATCGKPFKKDGSDTSDCNLSDLGAKDVKEKNLMDDGEGEQIDHSINCDSEIIEEDQNRQQHWSGLTFEERETLGIQCKRILDFGRAFFLKGMGFETELICYCDPVYSLENVAILAKKKR